MSRVTGSSWSSVSWESIDDTFDNFLQRRKRTSEDAEFDRLLDKVAGRTRTASIVRRLNQFAERQSDHVTRAGVAMIASKVQTIGNSLGRVATALRDLGRALG